MTAWFLLGLFTVFTAWFGIGSIAVSLSIHHREEDGVSKICWATAIGAALSSFILQLSALAGGFSWKLISFLLLTGVLFAAIYLLTYLLAKILRGREIRLLDARGSTSSGLWSPRWLQPTLFVVFLAAFGSYFVLSSSPHLSTPVSVSEESISLSNAMAAGQYVDIPLLIKNISPATVLRAGSLTLEEDSFGDVVGFLQLLLLGMGTYLVARPLLGVLWALTATMVVLLSPSLFSIAVLQSDLLGVTAFVSFAIAAWWRAVVSGEGGVWYALVAIMLLASWNLSVECLCLWVGLAVAWMEQLIHQATAYRLATARKKSILVVVGLAVICAFMVRVGMQGWSHSRNLVRFGPVLWATIPLALLERRLRGLAPLILVGISQFALLAIFSSNVIASLYALPPLAVAACWGAFEVGRFPQWPRFVMCGTLLLMVGLFTFQLASVAHSQIQHPLGNGKSSWRTVGHGVPMEPRGLKVSG